MWLCICIKQMQMNDKKADQIEEKPIFIGENRNLKTIISLVGSRGVCRSTISIAVLDLHRENFHARQVAR
jgi:hypothetical protein